MNKSIVSIPWQVLGERLEEFRNRLEEELIDEGANEQLAYLEISWYRPKQNAENEPEGEYRISWGDVGTQFPSQDSTEYLMDDEESGELPKVVQTQKVMAEELEVQLKTYGLKSGGVRALITSPNPGPYCSGWRCEYSSINPPGFYWHFYFHRGGRCFARRQNPCT